MKSSFVKATDEEGAKWAGVCQGLANSFEVDVFYIRFAFVITAILGGPGFLIYAACYLAMQDPKE